MKQYPPWADRVGLAYMQNMWVRNPESVRAAIERYGEGYRVRLIEKLLFMGCLTGRRLKASFGAGLLSVIQWEEASREIAGDAKTICAPDFEHINETLSAYQPTVVLTFGKVASDAVRLCWSGPLIQCVHPAARGADTMAKLQSAAAEFRKFV